LINWHSPSGKTQYLISKHSLIGDKPVLELYPGKKISIIAIDRAQDLVLLQVSIKLPGGFDFQATKEEKIILPQGKMIWSGVSGRSMQTGIIGGSLNNLAKTSSQPYLGILVMYNSSPAQVSLVRPESPAANAGLKLGDELISINGKKVSSSIEFSSELLDLWPGDQIELEWRNESTVNKKIINLAVLPSGSSNHPADKFKGGKSIRRDGFGELFFHDATIEPQECGTPVISIERSFLGLNIARFSRTSTLALPAHILYRFIASAASPNQ